MTALRAWVEGLIRDFEALRDRSLYVGNSYDLELALAIPAAWSPPGNDWVGAALLRQSMEQRGHNPRTRHGGHGPVAARCQPGNRPDLERT